MMEASSAPIAIRRPGAAPPEPDDVLPPYSFPDTVALKARARQLGRAGSGGSGSSALQFLPATFYVSPNSTPASCKWIVSEYLHEPLYALSRREVRSGHKPDVILHDGLSIKDATLASFRLIDGSDTRTWKVRLPPRGAQSEAGFELVSAGNDWRAQKRPVFKLAIETAVGGRGGREAVVLGGGGGSSQQQQQQQQQQQWGREIFEWRSSNNDNIRRILGGQALGWKLVRTARDAYTDAIPSPRGAWPKTSDGAEVVAVFSSNGDPNSNWRFAFLGTGRAGVLGYHWEVMAFMSAMIIMDTSVRQAEAA